MSTYFNASDYPVDSVTENDVKLSSLHGQLNSQGITNSINPISTSTDIILTDTAKLTILSNATIGYVLTSDSSGNASWQEPSASAAIGLLSSANTFTAQQTFTQLPISSSNPTTETQLTNKSYVDNSISTNKTNLLSGTNNWVGNNTFTILPTSSTIPLSDNDFSNKAYTDNKSNSIKTTMLSGSNAWTGANTFNASIPTSTLTPTLSNQFVTKTYTDNSITLGTNTLLNSSNTWTLTNTFNNVPVCATNAVTSTQLVNKQLMDASDLTTKTNTKNELYASNNTWLAENTFTNLPLCLSYPVLDNHLTNKDYVDSKIYSQSFIYTQPVQNMSVAIPYWCNQIDITCQGAGGGAGGSGYSPLSNSVETTISISGGGGGAGGLSKTTIYKSYNVNELIITVGTGGIGKTLNSNGTDGTSTNVEHNNFSVCRADGGKGGKHGLNNSTVPENIITGGDGGYGTVATGGRGADSCNVTSISYLLGRRGYSPVSTSNLSYSMEGSTGGSSGGGLARIMHTNDYIEGTGQSGGYLGGSPNGQVCVPIGDEMGMDSNDTFGVFGFGFGSGSSSKGMAPPGASSSSTSAIPVVIRGGNGYGGAGGSSVGATADGLSYKSGDGGNGYIILVFRA